MQHADSVRQRVLWPRWTGRERLTPSFRRLWLRDVQSESQGGGAAGGEARRRSGGRPARGAAAAEVEGPALHARRPGELVLRAAGHGPGAAAALGVAGPPGRHRRPGSRRRRRDDHADARGPRNYGDVRHVDAPTASPCPPLIPEIFVALVRRVHAFLLYRPDRTAAAEARWMISWGGLAAAPGVSGAIRAMRVWLALRKNATSSRVPCEGTEIILLMCVTPHLALLRTPEPNLT